MRVRDAQPMTIRPEDAEARFVLHGVSWATYVALRDGLDDRSGLKLTYLEGALELMSPSGLHEEGKKLIARLVEVWALERDVDLRGFGSTTFRSEAKARGLEPDECYKLGRLEPGAVPDIAIEVSVTRGIVDKMAVYAGLRIPEVWSWRPDAAHIDVLRLAPDGDRYDPRPRSEVVPDLDLDLLVRFVRPGESHTALARAYQAALRA